MAASHPKLSLCFKTEVSWGGRVRARWACRFAVLPSSTEGGISHAQVLLVRRGERFGFVVAWGMFRFQEAVVSQIPGRTVGKGTGGWGAGEGAEEHEKNRNRPGEPKPVEMEQRLVHTRAVGEKKSSVRCNT